MKSLHTQQDLRVFAAKHGLRDDWHEPDEQDIDARVTGFSFDNAMGADPYDNMGEMTVILYRDGEPEACINLATLLAIATDQANR